MIAPSSLSIAEQATASLSNNLLSAAYKPFAESVRSVKSLLILGFRKDSVEQKAACARFTHPED
jgi:hypothetical protein